MTLPVQFQVLGEFDEEASNAGDQLPSYSISPDRVMPVSKRAKAEMARSIQGLISYVERAHGLRIQVCACSRRGLKRCLQRHAC